MSPEYEKKIDDIHTALVGNDLGQKGIIKRLEAVEIEQENNNKTKYKMIGGGAVISFFGSAFITWLLKHF